MLYFFYVFHLAATRPTAIFIVQIAATRLTAIFSAQIAVGRLANRLSIAVICY